MPITSLFETALQHAMRGWPVFPVNLDKRPLTRHGFKDATADPGKVTELWTTYPHAGIGSPIPEGEFVLDVDPRNGGDNALAELCSEHEPLPATVTTITGGGGKHLRFRLPQDFNGTPLKASIGPGLDVKAAGRGYVILPPSPHMSGRAYRFEDYCDPDSQSVAEAPAWLVALVTDRKHSSGDSPGVNPAEILRGIPEGHRDEKLYRYACDLRRRWTPRLEAEALILLAAGKCRPPFPDELALQKVEQAWKFPAGDGRILAAPERSTPDKDLPRPRLVSLTLPQLEALNPPARELIVAPYLGKQETGFVYGPKGHGKTWVGLGSAIVAAQGNGARFLDFTAPGPGVPVLYVDGEMLTRDIRRRALDICRTGQLNPGDNLRIWTPDAQPEGAPHLNLFTDEGRQLLDDHLSEVEEQIGRPIELVCIDNLRTLFPGWEENKAETFTPIGVWTIRLRSRGKSVLLFHHANKDGGYSGNTAIVTTVHSILRVEHPKEYQADMGACFDLAYEWTRAGPIVGLENFNARLEGDAWSVETAGAAADPLIRILTAQGTGPTEIGKQIGRDRFYVMRRQKKLGLREDEVA